MKNAPSVDLATAEERIGNLQKEVTEKEQALAELESEKATAVAAVELQLAHANKKLELAKQSPNSETVGNSIGPR